MTARLATSVLVSGLVRRAEAQGGFAAILAKGDETAGSVILVLTERGANPRIFERVLGADGYSWRQGSEQSDIAAFIEKRRRFDPDLWVVELDTPSAESFAAELNEAG